jgi:hypothetical protein
VLHPTYKHLEDCIRLAGLSLAQWSQLFVCALGAFGLSKLLPLPGSWAVSVAITVCGLPAAGAVAFMQADFDVRRWLSDAARFRRGPRRFLPGASGADQPDLARNPAESRAATGVAPPDLEGLWDAA